MKRLAATIIIAALSAATFAGCGSATTSQQSAGTQSEQTASESTEGAEAENDAEAMTFSEVGISFKLPEQFRNIKGQLEPFEPGETEYNSGIYLGKIIYVARTADEYNKYLADSEGKTDEEQSQIRQAYHNEHYGFLCSFFAIKEDLDIETVIETHMGLTAEEAPYTEVGQANGLKYYYVQDPIDESLKETFPEEMYEEYVSLATDGGKI